MAQDEKNLIWLGTDGGLFLYDGYRSIPTPLDMTIYCLKPIDNLLYAGTTEGLLIYDPQTQHCTRPQRDFTEGRTIEVVGSEILIGTPEGLWSYDRATGRFTMQDSTLKNIYSLLYTEGKLYMGTISGLYVTKDGMTRQIPLVQDGEDQPFVSSIAEDRQRQCIWVGTGAKLLRYDLATGQVNDTPALRESSVKTMVVQDDGCLVVGTDNGLYTYQDNEWSRDLHNSRDPHSLADNVVWSTYVDREGNILLGTDGGVSVISHSSYYYYLPISEMTGTTDGNKMSSLLVDHEGRKWLGGSNGLIVGKRWYRMTDGTHTITHNRIRRVYEDPGNNIWIATDNSIHLYDEASGQMRNVIVTDSTGQYSSRWAYDIIDDGSGRMWIAAWNGGIFVVDKQRLKTASALITADEHVVEGLSALWVRQLVRDQSGHIWARTGKGLDCIDISDLKVKNIHQEPTGYIISDRQGRIWEAGKDSLTCYAPGLAPRTLSLGYNQPTEAVGLCETNNGIWVITNGECLQMGENVPELRLRIPDIVAYGAYYSLKDKCLYIGGVDGLVSINPSEINNGKVNRQLMLTNLLVNERQRVFDGQAIRLSHNENSLELWLSDLPYTGGVPVSYAYQLTGAENTWHLMSSVKEPLVYSSLPTGSYTLRIRTVDGVKQQNDVFQTAIIILPPWYWSWWAKGVYMLLMLGLLFWLNRFFMVRKQLAREKREKQLMLEQSKARMTFYTNMSHNLKGALYRVMMPLSEMVAVSKNKEQIRMISAIRSQTTQMNLLIRQAFDLGDAAEHDSEMQQSRINIVSFLKETVEGMKPALQQKKISVDIDTDSHHIYMLTEVLSMDSIFSILIQTLVRHSIDNGSLKVSLNTGAHPGMVLVTFSSSTMTVPENQRPYIFQRYVQSGKATDNLYIVKEYVETLGGIIRAEATDSDGTSFRLLFNILETDAALSTKTETAELTSEETISEKDENLMREITAAIEDHMFDSDFNVTMLQDTVGIGQKLLYRKVKQITGMTPVEYMRTVRLEKAARLLSEGRFSISEVMYMVGFTKPGYFSKCFQETFGVTPSAYIKMKTDESAAENENSPSVPGGFIDSEVWIKN